MAQADGLFFVVELLAYWADGFINNRPVEIAYWVFGRVMEEKSGSRLQCEIT